MKKFFLFPAVLFFVSVNCSAQPGNPDPSFGYYGRVFTNMHDVNLASEFATAMAIQPDGKIVILARTGFTMSGPTTILRYNTDGSHDTDFGEGGMVYCFEFGATAIAVQSDGKILVAGDLNGNFGLARFHPDGTADNSFDSDGILSTAIGSSSSSATCIALQPDGKIIVAGFCKNGVLDDFAVARYNTNGSPDNSFDGDGNLTGGFTTHSRASSIALQTNGKIIVAGYSKNGNNYDYSLACYHPDGNPDNSFDADGKLTGAAGIQDNEPKSVAIQADGKILLGTTVAHTIYHDSNDFAIMRFNPDGSPDNSFDGDGTVITDINTASDKLNSIAIQSDGKIVAAGTSVVSSSDIILARFNTNGSLDNSFDTDGKVITSLSSTYELVNAMLIQSNGKIVVAGRVEPVNNKTDIGLVRYNTDGSLDNGFDGDGSQITGISSSDDYASSLLVQPDGKIVLGGFSDPIDTDFGNHRDFALARYKPNGSLDSSFDSDGKQTTSISTNNDAIQAIAIQPDGKIVAAGYRLIPNLDIALARYNSDGSPDNSFDGDGKLITDVNGAGGDDMANAIAIQDDGKIVVGGYTGLSSSDNFVLLRYNPDGSPDNSFGINGVVISNISSEHDHIVSLAIQSDGKIVAAGYTGEGMNVDFVLARYNSNGSLDNSFAGTGVVITDINSFIDHGSSMIIQPDGKILVAGTSRLNNDNNTVIARYNADGSLDNSFDGDGILIIDEVMDAPALALQNNGKIIVAGNNIVGRFNANGGPDNSFNGDGIVVLLSNYKINDVQLYSNRIYLAGRTYTAHISDFTLVALTNDGVPAPLPLQFLAFSGKLANEDAVLNWKTENEVNTLAFDIERSTDGRNYIAVSSVAAVNSTGIRHYDFTDRQVISLGASMLYYRLKQKDTDGHFSYSRIIALPIDKNKNMVLFYPNPVINEANLAVTISSPGHVQVRIIDNQGKVVKRQQWNLAAGSTSLSVNLETLAKGIYYLELKGEDIHYKKQFIK